MTMQRLTSGSAASRATPSNAVVPDLVPGPRAVSERFRERLNQEHFLVLQRVSWLLVSQSFLFIVYAGIVVAKPSPVRHAEASRLFYAVPALGLVIVAGVYASILAARFTIRALWREFDRLQPTHPDPFDRIPNHRIRVLGGIGVHVPPLAIAAFWVWLLAVGRY